METELGDLGTGMISTIAYKPKTWLFNKKWHIYEKSNKNNEYANYKLYTFKGDIIVS